MDECTLWVQLGKQKKMRKEKDAPPLSRHSLKLRCTVEWMESWLDFSPHPPPQQGTFVQCTEGTAFSHNSDAMGEITQNLRTWVSQEKRPSECSDQWMKNSPISRHNIMKFQSWGKGVILQLLERNKAKQKWRCHMDRTRFQKGSRRLNSNLGSFQVSSDSGATSSGS